MNEQINRPSSRPALILTAQATNPIPLGSTGVWFDGTSIFAVLADGTQSTVMTGSIAGAKPPVRLATAAALASNTYAAGVLTAAANGALTVDGVLVANKDRILVKNEVAGSNNGIYVVTQKGTAGTPYILTRSSDADNSSDLVPGFIVEVSEGTANAANIWQLTTAAPITLDTTALAFAKKNA